MATTDQKQEAPQEKTRVNLKTLFDVVDDIWGYIETIEARNRLFGRPREKELAVINSLRDRIAKMRKLLHGDPKDNRPDSG